MVLRKGAIFITPFGTDYIKIQGRRSDTQCGADKKASTASNTSEASKRERSERLQLGGFGFFLVFVLRFDRFE